MIKKCISAMFISTSLFASSVGININSDTVEFNGEYNIKNGGEYAQDTDYIIHGSFLRSKDKANTEKLYTLGAKVINPYLSESGLSFGLGMKLAYADNLEGKDFTAFPLELFGSYHFNEKFLLDLNLAYAPEVLAIQDALSYKESTLKVSYQLLENGYIYIGARAVKTEYENIGTIKYDDNLFFGYKVKF